LLSPLLLVLVIVGRGEVSCPGLACSIVVSAAPWSAGLLLILLVIWPWPWSGRADLGGVAVWAGAGGSLGAHTHPGAPCPYPADIALLKKTWWPTADIAIFKKAGSYPRSRSYCAHAQNFERLLTLSR
jgi:hypothetical protein